MLGSFLGAAKANPLRFAALLLAGPPVALVTSPICSLLLGLAAPFLLPALAFVGVGRLAQPAFRPACALWQPALKLADLRALYNPSCPAGALVADQRHRAPAAAAAGSTAASQRGG